jgi:sulfatase maturation enzyme AslB (radical SAM superfamily)
VILDHLEKKGILSGVEVYVSTNGSVRNDRVMKLLSRAAQVLISVSVDGCGALNQFIRYGANDTEQLVENIAYFAAHGNVQINRVTSVMVYNVFALVELRDWWEGLAAKYAAVYSDCPFDLVVISPRWLNPCVLSDSTRRKAWAELERHQKKEEFQAAIKNLRSPYLGDEMHNRWVGYTQTMEKIRKNCMVEVCPQLEQELVRV